MASNWYVLRTEPRAEYLAATELGDDGFEVFFPRVTSPYNRVGHDDVPLFPGYLFLRCDPEADGWPFFRLRHRVAGWVRFGGVVPTIPDEVIAELEQRVEGVNSGMGLWRQYKQGRAGLRGLSWDGGPRRDSRGSKITPSERSRTSAVHGPAGSGSGSLGGPKTGS